MADRRNDETDRGGLKGDVPRSDHVAQPSERVTPEQERGREALANDRGVPEERRPGPMTTGPGSDAAEWGSEASGGSVIDTRHPGAKKAAEREQSPERIGERLREEQ